MRIEIIHHQYYLLGLWIVDLNELTHEIGPISLVRRDLT